MGDATDLILEGHLCAGCGVTIDDEAEGYDGACGYPRYCRSCGGVPALNGRWDATRRRPGRPRLPRRRDLKGDIP